jgi:galactose oxidase
VTVEYRQDNHFWLVAAAPGWVFHAGPSREMHWISLQGNGAVISAGFREDDIDAINGNAVLYDEHKIVTFGGERSAALSSDYDGGTSSSAVFIVDISAGPGQAAAVRRATSMSYPRSHHNSVLLPSGEVMVIGGKSGRPDLSTAADAVLIPELWDPRTETFTMLKPMTAPRIDYSVALLLLDGRVMSIGGSACGTSCPASQSDYEILTPPYLLQPDGSPAARPVILEAPTKVAAGLPMEVKAVGAASFVLVRMSSVTHTVNNDQRRALPAAISVLGINRYLIFWSEDSGIVEGNYMLFAMNSAGTPSMASVVHISKSAS